MYSFLNPDKVLKPTLLIFRICGLWRPDSSVFYRIYGIIFVCSGFVFTSFMAATIFIIEEWSQLPSAVWMALTNVCGCLKCLCALVYHKEFLQLAESARQFRLKSSDERALVDKRLNSVYIFGVVFGTFAHGAVTLNAITASTFKVPRLPFEVWTPFWDWKHSIRDYWFAWSFLLIGNNVLVLAQVTTEIYFAFLLSVISTETEIIGKRLKGLGNLKRSANDGKENTEDLKCLIECVELHLGVLKLKARVQNLMNFPYFCQIASSGIIISAIIVVLAMGRGEAFAYSMGSGALIMQIFCICFFADTVTEMNGKLPTQLYKSNWVDMVCFGVREQRQKFKSLMLVILGFNQREMLVLVGYIFPVSLSTFLTIINFAYRIYAIMSKQY